LLTAINSTLAHIARGAPLAHTLTCIVNGIEAQNPDITAAILLLNEEGNRLHLGAAVGRDSLLRITYIPSSVYFPSTIKICGYRHVYAYTPLKMPIFIKLPAPARLP
jgi:hypothetical protein